MEEDLLLPGSGQCWSCISLQNVDKLEAEEAARLAELEKERQRTLDAHMAKLEAEEKERLAKLEKEE